MSRYRRETILWNFLPSAPLSCNPSRTCCGSRRSGGSHSLCAHVCLSIYIVVYANLDKRPAPIRIRTFSPTTPIIHLRTPPAVTAGVFAGGGSTPALDPSLDASAEHVRLRLSAVESRENDQPTPRRPALRHGSLKAERSSVPAARCAAQSTAPRSRGGATWAATRAVQPYLAWC